MKSPAARAALGLAAIAVLLGIGFLVFRVGLHILREPGAGRPPILVRVGFRDLPGWESSDSRSALQAFARSCAVLMKQSMPAPLGGAGYAGTAGEWRGACGHLPVGASSAAAVRRFFETEFQPLEVMNADGTAALFTGYYEPELAASRTRHGPYQVPIYGPPDNLVMVDLGGFRPQWQGERLYGCLSEHRLEPCATRAQIDAKGLPNAPVLFYADDPVGVFFLHIQGSGRVRLENGSMRRASYAGQNGRPYKPIGRTLIERGWLDRAHMSMQSIRAWLRAHPAQARTVMESDPSYVFFKEEPLDNPAEGAVGSEGVPLTPGASLAIDPRVHPLGIPVYVAASRPDADSTRPEHPFEGLLVAQDTGGAIRGAARADVYWGWGAQAEAIAGRMKANGRFFVLVPKAVAARIRSRQELPVK